MWGSQQNFTELAFKKVKSADSTLIKIDITPSLN